MKLSLFIVVILVVIDTVHPSQICRKAGCLCKDDGKQTQVVCDCSDLKYNVRITLHNWQSIQFVIDLSNHVGIRLPHYDLSTADQEFGNNELWITQVLQRFERRTGELVRPFGGLHQNR